VYALTATGGLDSTSLVEVASTVTDQDGRCEILLAPQPH
jgi:hypothetical protein